MNQADQFVAALPGAPGPLLRRQTRCVYGMIVLIKEHQRRVLIIRIVGHKQIGGVPNEDPFGIKGMMLFEDPHHIPIKPRPRAARVPSAEPSCADNPDHMASDGRTYSFR